MIKKKVFLSTAMLVIGMLLSLKYNVKAAPQSTRLWGDNRYETCSAIVQEGWKHSSDYAVIVNGENFPDALSASVLAKKYDAPILLTESDKLNDNAFNQLKRLNVKQVFIVGGDFVIKPVVDQAIQSIGIRTTRYNGQNRNETSVKVADQIGTDNGIILTTDSDFTDSLSVAPIAAKLQLPIILVPKDTVPESVKKLISSKSISKTYVLGDINIISDSVANQFPNVQRINGKDKYERNVNIINTFSDKFNFNTVYLAYSEKFADALSTSAVAALEGNPIILAGDTVSDVTINFIRNKLNSINQINIIGGTTGIKDDELNTILNSTEMVRFKDSNLELAIRKSIEKPTGDIYKSDVEKIKTLWADGYKIKDISGIENLTNLDTLDLGSNEISDISALKGLSHLSQVWLDNNKISDISVVKELSHLNLLWLDDNEISDISALEGLTNLDQLGLGSNKISDLDALKGLNLTSLNLNNNDISYLYQLKELSNLQRLGLANNPINDLDELIGLRVLGLQTPGVDKYSKDNLNILMGLWNLQKLDLSDVKISDHESLNKLLPNCNIYYYPPLYNIYY